jgi:hypothetical protein
MKCRTHFLEKLNISLAFRATIIVFLAVVVCGSIPSVATRFFCFVFFSFALLSFVFCLFPFPFSRHIKNFPRQKGTSAGHRK